MTQKIGTVKVISKTGGILFADDATKWYNAANESVAQTTSSRWKELKGKEVTMELNMLGKYTEVKPNSSNVQKFPHSGTIPVRTSIRQTAINSAARIASSLQSDAAKNTVMFELAEKIEEWITREEQEQSKENELPSGGENYYG